MHIQFLGHHNMIFEISIRPAIQKNRELWRWSAAKGLIPICWISAPICIQVGGLVGWVFRVYIWNCIAEVANFSMPIRSWTAVGCWIMLWTLQGIQSRTKVENKSYEFDHGSLKAKHGRNEVLITLYSIKCKGPWTTQTFPRFPHTVWVVGLIERNPPWVTGRVLTYAWAGLDTTYMYSNDLFFNKDGKYNKNLLCVISI